MFVGFSRGSEHDAQNILRFGWAGYQIPWSREVSKQTTTIISILWKIVACALQLGGRSQNSKSLVSKMGIALFSKWQHTAQSMFAKMKIEFCFRRASFWDLPKKNERDLVFLGTIRKNRRRVRSAIKSGNNFRWFSDVFRDQII